MIYEGFFLNDLMFSAIERLCINCMRLTLVHEINASLNCAIFGKIAQIKWIRFKCRKVLVRTTFKGFGFRYTSTKNDRG